MQTMTSPQNQKDSAPRDDREEQAVEKVAELFKRIYGPAIKELATK